MIVASAARIAVMAGSHRSRLLLDASRPGRAASLVANVSPLERIDYAAGLGKRTGPGYLPQMCGRFDTSHLTWADIHAQLSTFTTVASPAQNMQPNDDVRPTTPQLTARLGEGGWIVEPMRWGLVPYWRAGKPLKDTAKGANDGWKMATFNARCEGVASASTFKGAFAKRRCIVPASAWFEWTGPAGSKEKHRFARADGKASTLR